MSITSFSRAALINEIRTANSGGEGSDFFELKGLPGENLDGLTYVIVSPDNTDGVISAAYSLDGLSIPNDKEYFFAARRTHGSAVPNHIIPGLNLRGPGSTTFLVSGFTGAIGLDLDLNNDGVLDVHPWTTIYDSVAMPWGSNKTYSPNIVSGSDSFFSLNYRINDGINWTSYLSDRTFQDWEGAIARDTPGNANPGPNGPPENVSVYPPVLIIPPGNYYRNRLGSISGDDSGYIVSSIVAYTPVVPNLLFEMRNNDIEVSGTIPPLTQQDRFLIRCKVSDPEGASTFIDALVLVSGEGGQVDYPVPGGKTGYFPHYGAGLELEILENNNSDTFTLRMRSVAANPGGLPAGNSATAPSGAIITPERVSKNYYWEIEPQGLTGTLSYRVTFNTAPVPGISDNTNAVLMKRSSSADPWAALHTTTFYTGSPWFESPVLNSFSQFTVGAAGSGNPLPVGLSSFSLE